MGIGRQIAVLLALGVQAQQPDAAGDQQRGNDHRGDGIDDIPGVFDVEHLQQVIEQRLDEDAVQRPDAQGDEAPAQQAVVLGDQAFQVAPVAQQHQAVGFGVTGRQVADQIVGVKKAVHPDDEGGHQQRAGQGAQDKAAAEQRDEGKPPLHIAVVHLPGAGDAGEDKGQ